MDNKEFHHKVDKVLKILQHRIENSVDASFDLYLSMFNELVFVKECLINYKELSNELKKRDFSFYETSKELASETDKELISELDSIKSAIS